MPSRPTYESFVDMPEGIKAFFTQQADKVYNPIIQDYKLPEKDFFASVERPVLQSTFGFVSIADAVQQIVKNCSTSVPDEVQRKKMVEALLQGIFWPLRDLFGEELVVYLREQKIETANWSPERVLFRPVSFSGAASEIINRLGLYSMGQQTRTVLRQFVNDYVAQKMVPSQIKEAMMRAPDFGGLGFDDKTADKALAVLQSFKDNGLEILSEEAYGDYLSEQTVRIAESLRQPNPQEAEDQQEIASIRATQAAPPKVLTELDKAVEAAIAGIPDKPTDEYLANRLRNVVSSRLRDVRNANELLSLLQRDSKVGGMGLDREKANAWSALIENAYKEHRGGIESEERGKLEVQLAEQKRKIEDRRHQEAEAHAKWYQEKIKSRQTQEQERLKLAEAFKKGFQQPAPAVEQRAAATEKKELGELVVVAAGKGPSGLSGPSSPSGGEVDGGKKVEGWKGGKTEGQRAAMPGTQDAGRATTPAPVVKVSAVTAQMATQAAGIPKPVDGVRQVAPHLQSLSGELGSFTLSQFRRLGKTPQEATVKLLQRFETLKEESFENKMNGVRSWQQSPVMKAYLDLVAKSFKEGKPISQIADAERAAGKDTLNREEIEALIQMNNQLHF